VAKKSGKVVSETKVTLLGEFKAPTLRFTNLSDNTTSEEVYAYDNAGNITSCTVSSGSNIFVYDQNNRLI